MGVASWFGYTLYIRRQHLPRLRNQRLQQLLHIPAALLLGAMAAGIAVAVLEGGIAVPHRPFVLAQGLLGCLVARSIGPAIFTEMIQRWPLFLADVSSVLMIMQVARFILVLLLGPILAKMVARWART